MVHLDLDEEERDILLQLLESCISDLRGEIGDTENFDYKLMLKGRRAVLLKLQEALQASQPVTIEDR